MTTRADIAHGQAGGCVCNGWAFRRSVELIVECKDDKIRVMESGIHHEADVTMGGGKGREAQQW